MRRPEAHKVKSDHDDSRLSTASGGTTHRKSTESLTCHRSEGESVRFANLIGIGDAGNHVYAGYKARAWSNVVG